MFIAGVPAVRAASVCFASLVFLCCSAVVNADGYAVSGAAYNLKSGKFIYRELISQIDDKQEVQVTYAKPDGVTFATKTLNYTTEVFQPGVVFNDTRDDETISAAFDVGKLVVTHRIKGDSVTKTFYDTARLIIDTGLDACIQQHWQKLIDGERIDVNIVDGRKVEITKFQVRKMDKVDSPLGYKGAGDTWVYFRMDSGNRISTLIGGTTYFAYDPAGKYLMRYQGKANIDSDTGEPMDVRVEYEYY